MAITHGVHKSTGLLVNALVFEPDHSITSVAK